MPVAAEMLDEGWEKVSAQAIRPCWAYVDSVSAYMQGELRNREVDDDDVFEQILR